MLPAHLADNIRTQVLFYLQSTFDFREKSVEAAFERFLTDPENGLFKGPWVQLRRPFRPEAEIHPHRLSNECVIQNHRDSFGPDNVDSTRDSGAERFHTPFRSSTVNVWDMRPRFPGLGAHLWLSGNNGGNSSAKRPHRLTREAVPSSDSVSMSQHPPETLVSVDLGKSQFRFWSLTT